VALARAGAEEAGRDDVPVAGSCGPYAAALADGSEYRGYEPDVTVSRLVTFHQERARILLDAGADLLAFETIPSRREATAVREVLDALRPATAWVSFRTPDGRHTPEGDDLADAARELQGVPGLFLGVNCSPPEVAEPALRRIAGINGAPLVVYPNIGDRWDPVKHRWSPDPGRTLGPGTIAAWLAAGASLVGGCCGTTPRHIRDVADALLPGARRAAHDTGNSPASG
jgi:homocysteine S-methyltransferase